MRNITDCDNALWGPDKRYNERREASAVFQVGCSPVQSCSAATIHPWYQNGESEGSMLSCISLPVSTAASRRNSPLDQASDLTAGTMSRYLKLCPRPKRDVNFTVIKTATRSCFWVLCVEPENIVRLRDSGQLHWQRRRGWGTSDDLSSKLIFVQN